MLPKRPAATALAAALTLATPVPGQDLPAAWIASVPELARTTVLPPGSVPPREYLLGNGGSWAVVDAAHGQIVRWIPTLPVAPDGRARADMTWRVRAKIGGAVEDLAVTRVDRVRGAPVVRVSGASSAARVQCVVFVDADSERVWWGLHVEALRPLDGVHVAQPSDTVDVGPLHNEESAQIYWSLTYGEVEASSETAFLRAASDAIRRVGRRRIGKLELWSHSPWLGDLIEDAACDLLVQQHRETGQLWSVHAEEPLGPADAAQALLGMLRLGHWNAAARALDAGLSDGSPDGDPSWWVLASYWYARASADLTVVDRHWPRLQAWAVPARDWRELPPPVPSHRRITLACVAQAMGSLAAMRDESEGRAPSRRAARWFETWNAMQPWVDERAGEEDPFLAPWLGHFFGGAQHDARLAADLRRVPTTEPCGSDAAARRLVALSHDRHAQRATAWRSLLSCARDGGDWGDGGPRPRDPARTGLAIDALLGGLMGARTTCWGPHPERIISLDLCVPAELDGWRATGAKRDRWQLEIEARRVIRALDDREREDYAGHPELAAVPEGVEATLLEAEVVLRSANPPAGAWQASVGLGGTLYQRYLTRERSVREIDVASGTATADTSSAAVPAAAATASRRRSGS